MGLEVRQQSDKSAPDRHPPPPRQRLCRPAAGIGHGEAPGRRARGCGMDRHPPTVPAQSSPPDAPANLLAEARFEPGCQRLSVRLCQITCADDRQSAVLAGTTAAFAYLGKTPIPKSIEVQCRLSSLPIDGRAKRFLNAREGETIAQVCRHATDVLPCAAPLGEMIRNRHFDRMLHMKL